MDKSSNLLIPDPHNASADIHICGACKAQFSDVLVFLSHKKECSKTLLPPHISQGRKSHSLNSNSEQSTSLYENSVQRLQSTVLESDEVHGMDIPYTGGIHGSSDGVMASVSLSHDIRDRGTHLTQSVSRAVSIGDEQSLYQEQRIGGTRSMHVEQGDCEALSLHQGQGVGLVNTQRLGIGDRSLHQDQGVATPSQRSHTVLGQQRIQHRSRITQDGFRGANQHPVQSQVPQEVETHLIQRNVQNIISKASQARLSEGLQQIDTMITQPNFHMTTSKVGGLVPDREEHHIQQNPHQITNKPVEEDLAIPGGHTVVFTDGPQLISSDGQQIMLQSGTQLSQIVNSDGQTILLRDGSKLSQTISSDGQSVILQDGTQLSQIVTSDGHSILVRDGAQLTQVQNANGQTVLKDENQLSQVQSSDSGWQHQTVRDQNHLRGSVDGISSYDDTEMFSGSETSMNFGAQTPRSEASNFQTNTNVIFHSQEQIEQMDMDSPDTSISEQSLRDAVSHFAKGKSQTPAHQKITSSDSSASLSVNPSRVLPQKLGARGSKRLKLDDLGMAAILHVNQDSSVSSASVFDSSSSTSIHDAATSAGIYDASSSVAPLQDPVPSGVVYHVPSSTAGQEGAGPAGGAAASGTAMHGSSFQQVAVNEEVAQIQNTPQTQLTGVQKRGLEYVVTIHDPDSPNKKRYKCSVADCSFTTTYIRDLERHNRVHTGERPFLCPLCPKSFSRSDKLNIHLRGHTGSKPFKCNFCDYGAADSSSLKKHIRIHTDERPFRCQICAYASRNSSQLIVHLRTHTGDSPFQCSVCDAKFKINSDLKRHMRIHTGEKPYACDLCDYRCSVRGNLKCHYRINHSSENQMTCPEPNCKFTSSSRKTLWEHKKTHDLLRPIKCDVCSYACASNSALKMHMRVHSADRPYNCSFCNYSSKQSGNVKTHIRKRHPETLQIRAGRAGKKKGRVQWSVTDEEPGIPKLRQNCRKAFKCNICSASFVREDSLRSHTRQHCREIEQNLESTALAVLEQQSGVGQRVSVIPQQGQLTALSPTSQQISGLDAVHNLNQNVKDTNSDHYIFLSPGKTGDRTINTVNQNAKNLNSDSYGFISPLQNEDKNLKFVSTSLPIRSESLSQQVVINSPAAATLVKDTGPMTYHVSQSGYQSIDDRMIRVSALETHQLGGSRSGSSDTVVTSAMQSTVVSHSIDSGEQALSSSDIQQNHPMLTAVIQQGMEVAVNVPRITTASQPMTYITEPTMSPAQDPVYLNQKKFHHTVLSSQPNQDQLTSLAHAAAHIQIPISSQQPITKKPVRIITQAQPDSTSKLVFVDDRNPVTDFRIPVSESDVVTHQLIQTSQGFQIIQNIPLHSLRLVGKPKGSEGGEQEGGMEKVVTHTVDTSSLQLADQQMLQPQLLQQVHTGPSDIGHIETVNVQVLKPSATQTSYPMNLLTQEVVEQPAVSQAGSTISQFQIVLQPGVHSPQIVRSSGQPQLLIQVDDPGSSRGDENPLSMPPGGIITLPISMAQTLLAQVHPQDSNVMGQNRISVIQDGVQLQEVIVAVDRSSLIGSAVTRGTEERQSEAK